MKYSGVSLTHNLEIGSWGREGEEIEEQRGGGRRWEMRSSTSSLLLILSSLWNRHAEIIFQELISGTHSGGGMGGGVV